MKKFTLLVVLLLIAAVALSACGTPSTDNKGAQSKTEEPQDEITLRFIESLTSPERTKLLKDLFNKFEAENPGIKVEIISPPLKEADNKIAQMLMAKQPLDVVEVREHTAVQFINNNWIENMDSYVENWEGMETLSAAAKKSMTRLEDHAYLIPYGFYQRCLYYRADWFKEAGLEPPKTWQELYDIGKKLTDPSKNRYGYSFRGGKGGVNYIDMLYWAYLGEDKLASVDAAYFTKDGKSIYSTPEAKQALEFHKKLYTDISPKDSIQWSFAEMVQGFIGGTTAMLIQDPEVIGTCQKDMEEGTWATAPMPTGPLGEAHFPNGYAGWGMTSYSEHKDEAWKLIAFLSSEEGNTKFAKGHSLIPIHLTAPEKDNYFKTGPFSVYITMAKEPEKFIFTMPPQQYKAFGEHWNTADQWYQKYLAGTITADECLKHFDEYWSKAYSEEGKLFK